MPTQPFPFPVAEAFSVRGQAVLVTGAAGFIGSVIAEAFAANGAKVLLSDRMASPLAAVGQGLRDQGFTAVEQPCDLLAHDELKALIAAGETHFGGLDTIVHCGAIPLSGPISDDSDEFFDQLMNTNLRSTWLLIKYAREMLIRRGGGSVINISSVNGHRAMVHASLYCASKAGVMSMTRELSSELGEHKIRLNTVSPGVIANLPKHLHRTSSLLNSPYSEQFMELFGAEASKGSMGSQPLPIGGMPIDVAMACIYLASPAARFVTGADILVDGGYLHAVHPDFAPAKPRTFWGRAREFLRNLPPEAWKEGHGPVWLNKK